LTGANFFY